MKTNILFLIGKGNTLSAASRTKLRHFLGALDVPITSIYFDTNDNAGKVWGKVRPPGSNRYVPGLDQDLRYRYRQYLDKIIDYINPKVIVAMEPLSQQFFSAKPYTPDQIRGGVYEYEGVKVVCLKNLPPIFLSPIDEWTFKNDIAKVARIYHDNARRQPPFCFGVAYTLADVQRAFSFLEECPIIAIDSETKGGIISSLQYTGQSTSGLLRSFVIPFLNPLRLGNAHWSIDEEPHVWRMVRHIHGNRSVKVLQNGLYDCAYFNIYGLPLRNYLLDTHSLFYSLWCETPRSLNFISSILLDNYQYWKDENKGSKEDSWGKTESDLWTYWEYGAKDTYYTWLNAFYLCKIITQFDWAVKNYAQVHLLNIGPYALTALRGLCVDSDRLHNMGIIQDKKLKKAREVLAQMTDDPEFNPNSNPEVDQLFFKILGARPEKAPGPVKKKTDSNSVDKKSLQLVAMQHPLFRLFVEAIINVKELRNNNSKYLKKQNLLHNRTGRFLYQMSGSVAESGRANCKNSNFWCGTNAQNLPKSMRHFCVADDGKMFVEIDYSASDAVFVAFQSQDENYIKNITDSRDTHLLHAAKLFNQIYNDLVVALRSGDSKVKNWRQVMKPSGHGANYQMLAPTMWFNIINQCGLDAVQRIAFDMGHKDALSWDRQKQIAFVSSDILQKYHLMYPGLSPWFNSSAQELEQNRNLLHNAFGRTRYFLGTPTGNSPIAKRIRREISAQYGQGDTAGNINRVLTWIYYSGFEQQTSYELLLQVHDSILGQVDIGDFEPINKLVTIMQEPVTIHGRQVSVPVEVKIGFTWGDDDNGMIVWDQKSTDMKPFFEHEQTIVDRYEIKTTVDDLREQLAS